MEFNIKKLASDATGFFNRAKQLTEETFLKAEKTELDANFENLLLRADQTEEHTKRLLSCIESYLQPNPTVRMEEVLYEKLELKKEGAPRANNLEHLATAMAEAGEQFGSNTPYGSALLKVAQTETKISQTEREFVNQSATHTLLPIRRFLEGDMKTIQKERKVLNSKRLDLDACKSRLRKAKTIESQGAAEADLRVAQAEFDKQAEITKLLLEGIQTAHNNQLKCIRDFVEAQMSFFAQSHQLMADLQRELSGTISIGGATATLIPSALSSGFPTVNSSSSDKVDLDDLGTKQARVIMDYDAVMPTELTVKQNDILIIYRLPGLDADFVMGEKGGNRGKVPISYLEIL